MATCTSEKQPKNYPDNKTQQTEQPMMGAFTQLMVNRTSVMSSEMAKAMGGKEAGDKVN